jgi:penicillin-binding protein A
MTLERRIWHVGSVVLLLVLALSCRIVYWPLVRAPQLLAEFPDPVAAVPPAADSPLRTPPPLVIPFLPTPTPSLTPTPSQTPTPSPTPTPSVTPTPTVDPATIPRGTIYDRNGRALAFDILREGAPPLRFYSEPSLAHVVGYVSGLRLGVTGIEAAFNQPLTGAVGDGRQLLPGDDVYLTIDSRLQRAAADALRGRAGAVVVLDGHSGAVLAMASSPAFDPNRILDPAYIRELDACPGTPDCRQALLNRAAQSLYTPGSTWKTATLMAALDIGQVTPDTVFDFGEPRRDPQGRIYYVYRVNGFEIVDPNHPERHLNLVRSFAVSANAAFARMGDEMPPDIFIDYAARLGFSRPADGRPPIEIAASSAQLAANLQAIVTNNPLRASTAIGQGELLASPLSMALMFMPALNEGHVPRPHLLQAQVDPQGNQVAAAPGGYWLTNTIRPETAQQVRDMMIEVVRNGSGFRAAVAGATVGGKTGTAQLAGDIPPHAWFTGFAQTDDRVVVIAVVIEHGGEGAQAAAPIFAQVATVALRHLGEPVEEIVPRPAE